MKNLSLKPFHWVFLAAVTLVVMTWLVRKASSVPLTHDEAFTFNHYVHKPVYDILTYRNTNTNNHILNTLLVKFSTAILGNHEMAIRLPSLLGFVAWSVFSFLLCFRFFSGWFRYAGYLLVIFNPYLLDFFGLARGYGLAICCMTIGLYFFLIHIQDRSARHWNLALLFSGLSVMANFTLILFFFSLVVIYQLVLGLEGKSLRELIRANRITFVGLGLLILFIAPAFLAIKKGHMIDFGGTRGFWEDTVMSLVHTTLYIIPWETWWNSFFVAVVIFHKWLFQFVWILAAVQEGKAAFLNRRILLTLNLVLLLVCGIHLLQHFAFGTPYIEERFATFLLPLFMLNLVALMDYYSQQGWLRLPSGVIALLLAGVMVYHTASHGSNRFYSNWKSDAGILHILDWLEKDRAKRGIDKVCLGATFIFEPSLNYYREKNHLDWLIPVNRDEPGHGHDYLLVDLAEPKSITVYVDTVRTQDDWPLALLINLEKHPPK